MRPLTRQPFAPRTTEELVALLSAVATSILAVIIVAMLYFGREVFVPIALAILLSFVLAPVVGILQRIYFPRGFAVVSVVMLAFALIFAMGSLLATQLTLDQIPEGEGGPRHVAGEGPLGDVNDRQNVGQGPSLGWSAAGFGLSDTGTGIDAGIQVTRLELRVLRKSLP